ncbi:MAG TPA: PmoA family protein [Planctomycetota bacterium]|nr:PmoA family protein [Planctomycetota bacterium]HRR79671.1 PmoA family protein [Planctomycetota bacterium]HRT93679.1 PmoA family protein [Planctomycetota bacterium]
MLARRLTLAWVVLALLALPARAFEVTLEVEAGDSDRVETPVCAPVMLPATPGADVAVEVEGPGGKTPGQLVPGPERGSFMLAWLVSLKKGEKATYKAKIEKGDAPRGFAFEDAKGDHLDLLFDGRKVTRFMYRFTDDPDAKKRFPDAKPFTHVFDSKGQDVITSPGGQPFPHHRGLFLGYKVKLPNGPTYDFWHVPNCWQRLDRFTQQAAGPVLGRMTALVNWADPKGEPVLVEERTITVYRQSKPEVLLDFVSTLASRMGDLDIGGDPEHAGVQFRPHFDVGNAENKKNTKYVFPPNMTPGGKGTQDMPWAAVRFTLRGSAFEVAHLNHPENPKGAIYSAYRDYGRFGSYAPMKLPADKPITLRYRLYVREAPEALTPAEVQRLYNDFATPPKVTVKQ